MRSARYVAAQIAGLLALLAVLAGVGWLSDRFDREDRYARCLPERGERTIATWGENGLICTVFLVGAYSRPSELARVEEVRQP